MNHRMIAVGIGLTLLLSPLAAQADPADGPCDQARAGYPQTISRFAMPSDTGRYIGYWLGGGCAIRHKAEAPYPDEGTWGWDYTGGLFRRNVDLGWWHGRRYQGGIGAYKTEGPKLFESE